MLESILLFKVYKNKFWSQSNQLTSLLADGGEEKEEAQWYVDCLLLTSYIEIEILSPLEVSKTCICAYWK